MYLIKKKTYLIIDWKIIYVLKILFVNGLDLLNWFCYYTYIEVIKLYYLICQ